jgi:C-terminal processing protease CtpA/Prc
VAVAVAAAAAAGCQEARKLQAFPDEYAGVGLELKVDGTTAEVVAVIGGGPAEEAGVRTGDRITKIDTDGVAGLTLADVVAKLRGPVGSQVMLSLQRGGEQKSTMVVVSRRGLRKDDHGGYRPEKQQEPTTP